MATEDLTGHHLDPESLVARIIEELRAKQEAQRLLLHAPLTNEFRDMPARLQHIEKDIAKLKTTTAKVVNDGDLKGSNLKMTVERRARGAR